MVYAGDSEADEYAIRRLKGVAYTFRVITEDASAITRTAANYRLEGTQCEKTRNLPSLEKYFVKTTTWNNCGLCWYLISRNFSKRKSCE